MLCPERTDCRAETMDRAIERMWALSLPAAEHSCWPKPVAWGQHRRVSAVTRSVEVHVGCATALQLLQTDRRLAANKKCPGLRSRGIVAIQVVSGAVPPVVGGQKSPCGTSARADQHFLGAGCSCQWLAGNPSYFFFARVEALCVQVMHKSP